MPRIVFKALVFVHACIIGVAVTALVKSAVFGTAPTGERSCQVKLVRQDGQVVWMPCSELSREQ